MSALDYWVYADAVSDTGAPRKFSYGIAQNGYYAVYTDLLDRIKNAGLRLIKHSIVSINQSTSAPSAAPSGAALHDATKTPWYEDITYVTVIQTKELQVDTKWR